MSPEAVVLKTMCYFRLHKGPRHLGKSTFALLRRRKQAAIEVMSELEPEMDNSDDAASSKEEYRSAISSPSFSHAVNLDFDTRDAGGQFVTPEGVLKHKILSIISTEAITAATGQLSPAHGVVGMAGVGKTIALQGLASDKDIRERFS